jgi:Ca-activated chloride channel family protein
MVRLEHPEYLYALLLIPLLAIVFLWMQRARSKAIRKLGSEDLLQQMMPEYSRYKPVIKFLLLSLALAFFIIGWANPQMGSKTEKVTRKGIDVFIAMDISQSMMAEDLAPNRLERAKRFTEDLVQELAGNRIGLILFAANAYLQMPLTTDYAAATLFVQSVNTGMAPYQGTAIGGAIELAEKAFPEDNKNHKAIIIITDGENHDEGAMAAAAEANSNGLLIFTVGVGTEEGSFVPEVRNGTKVYKKDRSGEAVRSRLDVALMQEIAEAGNGNYFYLSEGMQITQSLREQVDRMEKREYEQRIFDEYESYFQYCLLAGLLVLLIEFMLSHRKSGWLSGVDIFRSEQQTENV